jgi:hypothetical protein
LAGFNSFEVSVDHCAPGPLERLCQNDGRAFGKVHEWAKFLSRSAPAGKLSLPSLNLP